MSEPATIRITVNGAPHELPRASTVADLVRALGFTPQQVAVERNKDLVRRQEHAATRLADGDRVEVVTFFGGG